MHSRRYRKRGGTCPEGQYCPESSMLSKLTSSASGVLGRIKETANDLGQNGISGFTEKMKNVAQGAQQTTDNLTDTTKKTISDTTNKITGTLEGLFVNKQGGKRQKTKRRRAKRRTRR